MHEPTSIANQTQSSPAAMTGEAMPMAEDFDLELEGNDRFRIQLKLSVGASDDPMELEADAMADTVMRMPETSFVQRKSSTWDNEYDDERVRLKPLASQITPFIQAKGNGGGAASDSVSSRIKSTMGGGSAMDGGTKSFMESRFGADFGDVRIHHGNDSTELSRSLNAKAFTVSNNIYFNNGQYRPGTDTGKHLLAHELTHVVQQGSSREKHVQLAPAAHKAALPDVSKLIKSVRDADKLLLGLIAIIAKQGNATVAGADIVTALNARETMEKSYADLIELAVTDPKWVNDPVSFISTLGFASAAQQLYPQDIGEFDGAGTPLKKKIELTTAYHNRLSFLLNLIIPKVKTLAAAANSASNPDFVLEIYYTIIAHYVRLMNLPLVEALPNYAFMTSYYSSFNIINWYALSRYISGNLEPFYNSLLKVTETNVYPKDFADIRNTKSGGGGQTPRANAEVRAFEAIHDLDIYCEIIGVPSSKPSEVTASRLPADAGLIVEMFLDAHAQIAVLALWKPLDSLYSLLNQAIYAGTSITGLDADDRKRWDSEMSDLRGKFMDESRSRKHPNLDANYDGWSKRVQQLIDEIPPSVKKRLIAAAVVEQIPFLFVAGATVVKVGIWVSRITQGSRLLIALAEGATMTALNFVATPLNSPGRPSTATGWLGQLAFNVVFAGLGRFIFQGSGLIMDQIAGGRNLLIQIGGRIAVPIAGITLLQTTAQYIQEKINKQGGESTFTEMLTVNLILNGIGILLGAATMPAPPEGTALTKPAGGPLAPLTLTADELAKQANVPVEVAKIMLEIADRVSSYKAMMAEIQSATRKGSLTPEEFEKFRQSALDIIDFLEKKVPPLASYFGGNISKADILAGLDSYRARVQGWSYSAKPKILALLPEATPGLVRVGDSDTFVYDRDKPPAGLQGLLDDNKRRGATVNELPGGGWEALPATRSGEPLRLLPAPKTVVEGVPPSIEDLAKGPAAQAGLALVRAQKIVTPILIEAFLESSANSKTTSAAVTNILQMIRVVDKDFSLAWQGLENFFNMGGDVITLRRVLNMPDGASMAAERTSHVASVLATMAVWDQETVRGLQALYRIRPRTTTEAAGRLIEMPVGISTGVLQSIAVLEPVSRGLSKVIGAFLTDTTMGSTALSPQQIGALGALRSGIELNAKYPGDVLVFEEEQISPLNKTDRIIDINVYERVTTRVGSQTKTTENLRVSVEVKEVSISSLGKRASHQLALDIVRDSNLRGGRTTPTTASRPFFETLLWRVRKSEFQSTALQTLGITDPNDARVEIKMRRVVEDLLKSAFDDPAMKRLSKAELDGYKAAFSGVPFVEFF